MNRKNIAGLCLMFLGCSIMSGCITIEQEIFLSADGSGQMVMYISLPDLPEDLAKQSPGSKSTDEELAKMKRELTAELPATIRVKEIKEVRQNGVQGIYLVMEFKQLKDVEALLTNFGKSTAKESEMGSGATWSLQIVRTGPQNLFTQKFLMTMDDKKKAPKAAAPDAAAKPGETKTAEAGGTKTTDDLDEQLKPLLLSLMRLRFTLHTPAPITSSNADIVLGDRTAVWNCSLSRFAKDKSPIEMTATY